MLAQHPVGRTRGGGSAGGAAQQLEITIKSMLGRLELPGGDGFPRVFAESGLVELPFASVHAAALAGFPALARRDPLRIAIRAPKPTKTPAI